MKQTKKQKEIALLIGEIAGKKVNVYYKQQAFSHPDRKSQLAYTEQ